LCRTPRWIRATKNFSAGGFVVPRQRPGRREVRRHRIRAPPPGEMPVATVKPSYVTPSSLVTSDHSWSNRSPRLSIFASGRINGSEVLSADYFHRRLSASSRHGLRAPRRQMPRTAHLSHPQRWSGRQSAQLESRSDSSSLQAAPLRKEVPSTSICWHRVRSPPGLLFKRPSDPYSLLWDTSRATRTPSWAPFWANWRAIAGVNEWTAILGTSPVLILRDECRAICNGSLRAGRKSTLAI